MYFVSQTNWGCGNMRVPAKTMGINIEWERYRYRLPKTGAEIEIVREIVMNDEDLDSMELSKPN